MRPAPVFVGIDVSKLVLDVAVHPTGEDWRVPNDAAGIADLLVRLQCIRPTKICFEATSTLHWALMAALLDADQPAGLRRSRSSPACTSYLPILNAMTEQSASWAPILKTE